MEMQVVQEYFRNSFPESLEYRTIGVEYEYPAVFSNGEGIPFAVVEALYAKLAEAGWDLKKDEATGQFVDAYLPVELPNGQQSSHMVTTDAGVHTIEIGLAPMQTLQAAEAAMEQVLEIVLRLLSEHDATLLGYGIQPVTPPGTELLAPRGRYRFLQEDFDQGIAFNNALELHASPDGQYNGHIPFDYGIFTLSAAGQTHIDITRAEAVPLMNALNRTSGLRIALTANSSVWKGQVSRYKSLRELFWDWGWTNRSEQTGFAPHFEDIEHYLRHIFSLRSFMIQRDQAYYRLDMTQPFGRFMESESQRAEALNGEWITVSPELDDVHFQCGTAWWTTRLQSRHGTIEDRCPCNQPPEAHLVTSALLTGLVENQTEFIELAERFPRDIWRDIRLAACKDGMQAKLPQIDVQPLVQELVSIAIKGLEMRGHGEADYLTVLKRRADAAICPADDAVTVFEAGGASALVERFTMQQFLSS
jgi:gamma-glutamylcysteine synthetase